MKNEDGTTLQEPSSSSSAPPSPSSLLLCVAHHHHHHHQHPPLWHCAADQETWLTLEVEEVALVLSRRSTSWWPGGARTHLDWGVIINNIQVGHRPTSQPGRRRHHTLLILRWKARLGERVRLSGQVDERVDGGDGGGDGGGDDGGGGGGSEKPCADSSHRAYIADALTHFKEIQPEDPRIYHGRILSETCLEEPDQSEDREHTRSYKLEKLIDLVKVGRLGLSHLISFVSLAEQEDNFLC